MGDRAIVAVHAIFLLAPPLALTDVFNYINYGRMEVVHHLNPYTTIPIVEPHADPSFEISNWHELLSPYGPMFTILTFVLVPLGVAAPSGRSRAMLAAASLAIDLPRVECARMLGRDPVAAIVLVGLNPIVLVWGLGGDHNDFLMVLLITLGFYLLLLGIPGRVMRPRRRSRGAPTRPLASARAAGCCRCPRRHRRRRGVRDRRRDQGIRRRADPGRPRRPAEDARRLVQVLLGVVLGVAVCGAASLWRSACTSRPEHPELAGDQHSVPNLVGLALGAGGESDTLRTVVNGLLVVIVGICCLRAWRGGGSLFDRTITASGWASVALLLTLSWVLPWYVLWLLPLAALSRRGACAARRSP